MSEEEPREFYFVVTDTTGEECEPCFVLKSAYDSLQQENEDLKHEILELKEDLGFTKSQLKRAWKSIRSHVSRRRFYRKENDALKTKLEKSKEILKRIAGTHEKYQCDDFDDCQMTAEELLDDMEAERGQ